MREVEDRIVARFAEVFEMQPEFKRQDARTART
jgi:hypothetical protein